MNKTKIDYAEYTWNPVYGCRNGCPYCYARRYCERFSKSFEPHWVQKNFERAMPKKPSIIFVNSMSDIYWWEQPWAARVMKRIKDSPEHIFLFLTKQPRMYGQKEFNPQPENCWYGFTATNDNELLAMQANMYGFDRVWCSAEPLLGPIESIDTTLVKWLVVGAMTGPGAVPIESTWGESIFEYYDIPLFIKSNMPCVAVPQDYPREMLEQLGRMGGELFA